MIFGQEYDWVEETTLTTPLSVINNGSLYIHVFYGKRGEGERVFNSSFQLNVYEKVEEEKEKKYLLGSFGEVEVEEEEVKEEEGEEGEVKEVEIGNFWVENYTLVLVNDETKYRKNILPEAVKKEMIWEVEEGKG